MSKLGEILRKRRKELNLTPDEIAEKIGKSKRSYLYYEEDKEPRHDVLQKLAQILQFDPADLYEDAKQLQSESEPEQTLPATQEEMTAMFLMLIEHLKYIRANSDSVKEVARQNNSLLQTVLLRMAEEKAPGVHEAQTRFQGSLKVAEEFLKSNFERIEKDKYDHAEI